MSNGTERAPGRVGVLMGGLSTERPVSFKSGKAVLAALLSKGYDAVAIDVGRDVDKVLRAERIDTAFPVLHGKWGEDGSIQGLLECLGIPYAGPSVFGAALTMDKEVTLRLLEGQGIPVPKGLVWTKERGRCDASALPMEGPWIVKPVREGSSFGVTRVTDPAKLADAVEEALALDERALVEELLDGPELTVGVLEGRALPVVEIAPKDGWFDFERKYTEGMTEYHVPARISAELTARVQEISLRAAVLTRCATSCRVDVMAGGPRGPRVLEVNTIPGMTGTSLLPMAANAVGIDFPSLCERLLLAARLRN
ncbi:MAG: D-alanine--D-alanine ligase [Deltaproteobacteria bacterium]|nr:D-alanine--D-alanine ligase [Deltaproteobacteria bacterium]